MRTALPSGARFSSFTGRFTLEFPNFLSVPTFFCCRTLLARPRLVRDLGGQKDCWAMSQKSQVLVVDDDLAMCGFLRSFLGARGYGAVTATNADEAVRRFHADRPAAVLLDVVMPGSMDGLAALAAFKKIDKDVPIIVISGQGRTNTVVQAMKLGATDFVCKPFEDADLEVLIANALKQRQLSQEVATLREQLKEQSKYMMLFGHSEKMTEVQDLIERVSDTDVTVLIRGESGPGKELVARALPQRSLRKD